MKMKSFTGKDSSIINMYIIKNFYYIKNIIM